MLSEANHVSKWGGRWATTGYMRTFETRQQSEPALALKCTVFKDFSLVSVNTEFWYIQSDKALLRTIGCAQRCCHRGRIKESCGVVRNVTGGVCQRPSQSHEERLLDDWLGISTKDNPTSDFKIFGSPLKDPWRYLWDQVSFIVV